jgi:hypothetical protein
VIQGPSLNIHAIPDGWLRRNFDAILQYFRRENQLEGFRAYEVIFTEAQENYRVKHGLGFAPKDVLLTRITGVGHVTFHHDETTVTEVVLTASDACEIRFLLGTHHGA